MTDTTMEAFKQAMQTAGIEPPAEILADGTLHRFTVPGDKARSDNGFYTLHPDGIPAGQFGCWKRGISETWSSKEYKNLTPDEKARYTAKMEAMKRQRDEERERIQAECRAWCADTWEKAKEATNESPYLKRKGVPSYGLKAFGDTLMVPLMDMAGVIHGIQFISADGSKKFKTGTNKAGHFYKIGKFKNKSVVVCEGYATGASLHQATGHCVVIAFDAGNLKAVTAAIRAKCPSYTIIIAADDDHATEGNPGLMKATEAARAVNGKLAVPVFQDAVTRGTDFNDLHQVEGLEAVRACIEAATVVPTLPEENPLEAEPESLEESPRIHVVNVLDFMAREFPPRENLLAPWLPVQGLTMVYAPRGIGKTHFSLGVSYAVASGGEFLGWQAPRAASVLFLDGEMPAVTLQERIARINLSSSKEPAAPFRIITPDLQNPATGMIDLSRPADQRELEQFLEGVELIVVDNLSTLCRSGKESEGEGWLPVQDWTLRQRAAGRSVLLVHHSGKNGEQRGTSRREDVLDTVIALKRPADYSPDKGATFEVHFEKSRGIYGEDTKPFEAQLNTNPISGLQEWTVKSLDKSTAEKVAALLDDGLSQMEIAEMLKITKGAVSKAKKKALELGMLKGSFLKVS
jgi:putative DNA primase/helicase